VFSLILLAVLLVAMAASLLAMSTVAEARPHHRHHHRVHHHAANPAAPIEAPSWWETMTGSTGNTSRVQAARAFIGRSARDLGLPRSLWCADFMNLVERRLGHSSTGSRAAMSFASYGQRVRGPVVGAIATMGRRGGGHVGVVTGVTPAGDPIILSGNHGRVVAEGAYPRSRIRSYSL
jgi:uncharacterized protein (TIGR02594 family)